MAAAFQRDTVGNDRLNINLAAAAFISNELQKHGLLPSETGDDSLSTGDGLETDTEIRRDGSHAVPKSPKERVSVLPSQPVTSLYLPFLTAKRPPQITTDLVDDLAFVLSGVNPSKRVDLEMAASGKTLRELYASPQNRLPASSSLLQDHQYVLVHLHQCPRPEFLKIWNDAKEQLGGQKATDLLKLSRELSKFPLDDSGEVLADPKSYSFLEEVQGSSILLLHRQFRIARKKLDELHTEASEPGKTTNRSLGWVRLAKPRKKQQPTTVEVDESERKIVNKYLRNVCKLGRLLRCDHLARSLKKSTQS
ncbi:MAG: hypothetical protein AAFV88_10495 [Planctomycetota bacterium]